MNFFHLAAKSGYVFSSILGFSSVLLQANLINEFYDNENYDDDSYVSDMFDDNYLIVDSSTENDQPRSQKQIKPLPYRPLIDKASFYTQAEFLYWKVQEGELNYTVIGEPSQLPPGQGNSGAVGTYKNATFETHPGVRIGAGYRFKPEYWEVEGGYTYFFSQGSQSEKAPSNPNKLLNGTFHEETGSSIFIKATSHISFTYQTADLLIARRFLLTPSLLTRFKMGFTGAWINQHWKFTYIGTGFSHFHLNWHFHGGGFKFGADTEWLIWKGIGLEFKVAGAVLYGEFKSHQKQISETPSFPPAIPFDVKNHDNRLVTTFQVLAGPTWGKQFHHWGIKMFAGYELNNWYNLQEVYRSFFGEPTSGKDSRNVHANIGLQGLTVNLNVNF
ncbi:MAG: hypothetical protein KF898_06290 [Parachlamydiales bacterium]|nr:hypothetical protein [Candidatus Acheromyda pituitae]